MKSEKFQGDMLNFRDLIQVFVFTTNYHLKQHFFDNSQVLAEYRLDYASFSLTGFSIRTRSKRWIKVVGTVAKNAIKKTWNGK